MEQRDEMASPEESNLLLHARGKATTSENPAVKPRSRCVFFVVIITAILLVAAAVLTIPTLRREHRASESPPQIHGADAIAIACNATRFPETCTANLTGSPASRTAQGLTVVAMTAATDAVASTLSHAITLGRDPDILLNATYSGLVDDCKATLGLAHEHLERSAVTLGDPKLAPELVATLQTSISGALTLAGYCADGLARVPTIEAAALRARAHLTFQIVSNALALVNNLAVHGDELQNWTPTYFLDNRATTPPSPAASHAPSPPSRRRRTLLDSTAEFSPSRVLLVREFSVDPNSGPNVTVALDGSGDFTSVQEAVNAAPVNSAARFVIHIKAGTYDEIVRVASNQTNVVFLGDGINRTIITGNSSVRVPGVTTFKSATVGVEGEGFMAKGVTFRNTAGAAAEQAVALRVTADKCAFWQCSMDAFQDTLWAQAFRQFYKECTVAGTVDFVFGNAAAVLQDCSLLARSNLPGKHNVYTAQGRSDPGQCTGFAIHNCTLGGTPDLNTQLNASSQTQHVTYLGRPWKQFSLTVISESNISALVDPAGWLPWSGDFALDTLFFGEYSNIGPGANMDNRVNWSTTITDPSLFSQLLPSHFLAAETWLPGAGIPFTNSF